MACGDVGAEAWMLLAITSPLAFLFLVRPRLLQRWAGRLRIGAGSDMASIPSRSFEQRAWVVRLWGLIPLAEWLASLGAVYCFLSGPR